MKHKPNLIGACLAAAVAMAGLAAAPASAATLKADCDKGQSIQQKLNITNNGDTVEVSGTCTESVVLRTDWVTLICVDGASITGEASAAPATTTVSVLARNATVEDCAISGPASNGSGIAVFASGSATLIGNDVSGLQTGAVVSQGSYGRIVDNDFTGNTNGLVISSASHVDVYDNDITGNGNGVLVTRSAVGEFVGNRVNGNTGTGFLILRASVAEFSKDVTFGDAPNEISNNTRAIFCSQNSALAFGVAQTTVGNTFADLLVSGCNSSGP